MRVAVYRIHYGTDFLQQSIESIIDFVDAVHVFYSPKPWIPMPEKMMYMGREIVSPENPENPMSLLAYLTARHKKITAHIRDYPTPRGQFAEMAQEAHGASSAYHHFLFMEPDMVFDKRYVDDFITEFEESNLGSLGCSQIEMWKNHEWRIPQRPRLGPTLWTQSGLEGRLRNTFSHFDPEYTLTAKSLQTYNFGFCFNEKTMLYKHLLALHFSKIIGDSEPAEDWYESKWLNWTPETKDLEISKNYRHFIPSAHPYEMDVEFKKQVGFS